jgi:hypothetical protein
MMWHNQGLHPWALFWNVGEHVWVCILNVTHVSFLMFASTHLFFQVLDYVCRQKPKDGSNKESKGSTDEIDTDDERWTVAFWWQRRMQRLSKPAAPM